jgi:hypothetical protein
MPAFQDPEIYRTIPENLKVGICLVDRKERLSYGTTAQNGSRAICDTKSSDIPAERIFLTKPPAGTPKTN